METEGMVAFRSLNQMEPIELPSQLQQPEALLEVLGPVRGVTDSNKLRLCTQLDGRLRMSMWVSEAWYPPLVEDKIYMPVKEVDEIKSKLAEAENKGEYINLGQTPRAIRSALLLSEAIYSTTPISDLDAQLQEHAISDVAISQAGSVKYMIARTEKVLFYAGEARRVHKRLYVAIRGTVTKEDLEADIRLEQYGDYTGYVHSGFSDAAQSIPVSTLTLMARSEERELIFCGHSLGGAIAHLLTLQVLAGDLDPDLRVTSIAFGAPHVASDSVAKYIRKQGWDKHFVTFVAEGDCVPSLLNLSAQLSHLGTFTELHKLTDAALPLLQGVIPAPGLAKPLINIGVRGAASQLQPYWEAGLAYAQGVGLTSETMNRVANSALHEPYSPFGTYHFVGKFGRLESYDEQTGHAEVNALLTTGIGASGFSAHKLKNYKLCIKSLTNKVGWKGFSESAVAKETKHGCVARERKVLDSKDSLKPVITSVVASQTDRSSMRIVLIGENLSFICPHMTIFEDIPVKRSPNDNKTPLIKREGFLRDGLITLLVQLQQGLPLEPVGRVKLVTHFGTSADCFVKSIDIASPAGCTDEEAFSGQLSQAQLLRAFQRGTLLYALGPKDSSPDSVEILRLLSKLEVLATSRRQAVLLAAASRHGKQVTTVPNLVDDPKVHRAIEKIIEFLAGGMQIHYKAGWVTMLAMGALGVIGVISLITLAGAAVVAIPAMPVAVAGSTLAYVGLGSSIIGGSASFSGFGLYQLHQNVEKNHVELLSWLLDAVPFPEGTSDTDRSLYSSTVVPPQSYSLQVALIHKARLMGWTSRSAESIIKDSSFKLSGRFLNVTEECRAKAIRMVKACQYLHEIQQLVRAGCFVGMMGSQDAGKTTLCRRLVGDDSMHGIGMDVHTVVPERYTYEGETTLIDFPGLNSVDSSITTVANRMAWLSGSFVYLQLFTGDPSASLLELLRVLCVYDARILICLNQASRFASGTSVNNQLSSREAVQQFVDRYTETIEAEIEPLRGRFDVWVTDFVVDDLRLSQLGIKGLVDLKSWLSGRLDFAKGRARQ